MKTLAMMVIALFSYTNNNHTIETILQEQQYVGRFAGLTDDYYFEFKDDQGKSTIFNEINNDVDVDLFDDDAVGKKYQIT